MKDKKKTYIIEDLEEMVRPYNEHKATLKDCLSINNFLKKFAIATAVAGGIATIVGICGLFNPLVGLGFFLGANSLSVPVALSTTSKIRSVYGNSEPTVDFKTFKSALKDGTMDYVADYWERVSNLDGKYLEAIRKKGSKGDESTKWHNARIDALNKEKMRTFKLKQWFDEKEKETRYLVDESKYTEDDKKVFVSHTVANGDSRRFEVDEEEVKELFK